MQNGTSSRLHPLPSLSSYADEEDEEGLEHLPPPRLFCDICDVFDEHDTDDCPTQASASDSPPHSSYHGARAPGGSDRPYCENCEGGGSFVTVYPIASNPGLPCSFFFLQLWKKSL